MLYLYEMQIDNFVIVKKIMKTQITKLMISIDSVLLYLYRNCPLRQKKTTLSLFTIKSISY